MTACAILLALGLGASQAADVNWTWRHQKFDYEDLSGVKTITLSGTSYQYQTDLQGAEKRLTQNLGGYAGTRVLKKTKTATRATMDLWLDATTSRTLTSSAPAGWQSLISSTVVASGTLNWQTNRINSRPAMVLSNSPLTVSGSADTAGLSVFVAGKFDSASPPDGTLIQLGSGAQPWSIRVSGGQFVASSGNSVSNIPGIAVPSGVWVVALRLSGTTANLYVNNTSQSGTIDRRTSSATTVPLSIGTSLSGLNLGEIRLFKRALPDDSNPNDRFGYQNFIFDEMRATWGAR